MNNPVYREKITGKNNYLWKDESVGYVALHEWIYRHYGKAIKCENCKTLKSKRYEWANISGEYKRDRNDFMQLCTSCHRRYDLKN